MVVQKEAYLLELCRYIVLNPVRAFMVEKPEEWKWSSYLATAGKEKPQPFLTTDWILAHFGKRRKTACEKYVNFVYDGIGKDGPWDKVEGGIFLGDSDFIKEVRASMDEEELSLEIPRIQRKASRPTLYELFPAHIIINKRKRDRRVLEAFRNHLYTQREIGEHLNLHPAYLSQIIKQLRE